MEAATTPFLASSRKVGIGSLGSSRAYAGNPSKLMTTTVLSLRTFVSASIAPGSAHTINVMAHNDDKNPTSFLNDVPYLIHCWSQLGAEYKAKTHIVTRPHDVVCSPGVIEEIAVNASR